MINLLSFLVYSWVVSDLLKRAELLLRGCWERVENFLGVCIRQSKNLLVTVLSGNILWWTYYNSLRMRVFLRRLRKSFWVVNFRIIFTNFLFLIIVVHVFFWLAWEVVVWLNFLKVCMISFWIYVGLVTLRNLDFFFQYVHVYIHNTLLVIIAYDDVCWYLNIFICNYMIEKDALLRVTTRNLNLIETYALIDYSRPLRLGRGLWNIRNSRLYHV